MTHRLAGILSDYLSREQMIEKDEADIYQYGLEILWTVFWKHCS